MGTPLSTMDRISPTRIGNVQRNAVPDDAGGMSVKHTGRKRMQRELSVIVHDRVSRVRSPLKPDDDVCLTGQHVRDLSLSLIAPVSSYNRFDHFSYPFLPRQWHSTFPIA